MAVYELIADKLLLQLEKEKRVADLSNEFNHIATNWQKVQFAEKIWLECDISADVPFRIAKSNERSRELRQTGNQFFSLKNKDYVKALELYNQSICAAETGAEDLAIGYANRSAIYFEWKKYDLCLENIKLAKKCGYPDRLMDKLNKRETECRKYLNDDNETSGEEEDEEIILMPKLSYGPHAKVPFIGNCLDMEESKEFGRYIVANRDLKVGQVVAIEDGFCTLTLPCVRYQRCANCLAECELSLIPCAHCTSTMFCSDECAMDAYTSFHKYECPVIDFMYKMFNSIQLSAIRVTLCALTSFDSVADLLSFTSDSANISSMNAFTLNYSFDPMPKSELYKPIHTLETNQNKRSTADLFQRAVVTAVIQKALLENTPLAELLQRTEEINLLTELIFCHLQTASTNFHRLETLANTIDANNLDDVSYGSGAYGFCSLINHACSPNIVRLPIGRRISVFVLRPIKAGEQLLDNYGYHHSHERLDVRQKHLQLQYKFRCVCTPCRENYPLFSELKAAKIPALLNDTDIVSITQLNKKFARDNFSRFCSYLHEYSEHYPCEQISSVEECLKMCLHLLIGNVPLKLKHHH